MLGFGYAELGMAESWTPGRFSFKGKRKVEGMASSERRRRAGILGTSWLG